MKIELTVSLLYPYWKKLIGREERSGQTVHSRSTVFSAVWSQFCFSLSAPVHTCYSINCGHTPSWVSRVVPWSTSTNSNSCCESSDWWGGAIRPNISLHEWRITDFEPVNSFGWVQLYSSWMQLCEVYMFFMFLRFIIVLLQLNAMCPQ